MKRLNGNMKNENAGGAIIGGILGSMFGDTTGDKIAGGIIGGILGDVISDELEDEDRTVVVHHRYESREVVSYFEQLKCEIKQECRRIENSYSGNNFGAYSGLEKRVRNAFYGHKISYFEQEELLGIIESSRSLSW